MPRRIARLEMDVLVVRGTISLFDDGGEQIVPDLNDLDQWLFTGDNAIVAASAGSTDHFAAVAIEAWDGEPPGSGPAWEVQADRTLRLGSGDLEVHPLVPPPGTQLLRAGPPGPYRLRAYTAGRAAIAALTPNPDIYALRGVERFLFQLWPDSHRSA
ncbi:hypothetical protein ETD86_36715 [Nonomuraea turkmeniaca]|uniref:Uncharacterized protein n=1 Tax=Nonomuraea turkmeniaca TaxID=103838 RepID=A0A5S4F4R2_9ACTN|nr:hypothetical protein [Nonomuraea turkmeniaca]TMR11165.1 hypothetical protein ETD86_36715 [Nonomuraea turkmeniaca]